METRNNRINYGDRIFARVTKNGRTVFDFKSEKVTSIMQFLQMIRDALKGVTGLVLIHIRNYNEGWNQQRPLFL